MCYAYLTWVRHTINSRYIATQYYWYAAQHDNSKRINWVRLLKSHPIPKPRRLTYGVSYTGITHEHIKWITLTYRKCAVLHLSSPTHISYSASRGRQRSPRGSHWSVPCRPVGHSVWWQLESTRYWCSVPEFGLPIWPSCGARWLWNGLWSHLDGWSPVQWWRE